jgi:hypothetical protein
MARLQRCSSRRTLTKLKQKEENYWTSLVVQNGFDLWVSSAPWHRYWNPFACDEIYAKEYQMIKDTKKYGFILYSQETNSSEQTYQNEVYIEFALVDFKHRKKHVLTQLFHKLRKRFPNRVIKLESRTEAIHVWKKLGFRADPHRSSNYYNHLVYFPKI